MAVMYYGNFRLKKIAYFFAVIISYKLAKFIW